MATADHLQVPRQHGLFQHHGIDLGDGTVAHYLEGRQIQRSPLEDFSRGQSIRVVPYD
ncbi:MAG: lecithin retinol acyltransferase family protein, partial [Vulcanococcus sp.]